MTKVIELHRPGLASPTRSDCELFYRLIITRSLISSDDSYRVGDSAKNAFHSNPENTIFDAKRLIGRKFDDNEVQRDRKHWPFQLLSKGGKPSIQIKHRGDLREFVSVNVSVSTSSFKAPSSDVRYRPQKRLAPWFL